MDTMTCFNRRHSTCATTAFALINAAESTHAIRTLLGRQTVLSGTPMIHQSFPLSLDHPVTRVLFYGVPQSPQFITSPFSAMQIPPLSTGQAGEALQLVTENHAACLNQLADFAHDCHATESESEDETSDCPPMDTFIESDGAAAVLQMTDFSLHEFNAVWYILEDDIVSTWSTGRG